MISEKTIHGEYNKFRQLIGRPEVEPSKSDIVYAHFKAGYMLAMGLDLKSRGVSRDNWQGEILQDTSPGEDLL